MRLRPVVADDLDVLCGFFASPHVHRWWHQDATEEVVAREYLHRDDGTTVLLALVDERPVGLGQWYRWDDDPASRDAYGLPVGAVGIDYLIGSAFDCERGLGTQLVACLVAAADPLPVWVTPEAENEPSRRVLENNGFVLMAVKQCQVPEEPWAGPTALYKLDR